MKIKLLRWALVVLGFSFQYTIPLILFGRIIPYTHGEIGAGLTKMGIFALCIFGFILSRKLKKRIERRVDDAMRREIFTSLLDAIPVILVAIFLRWLAPAIASILDYWYDVILLFIIGRCFYIGAASVEAKGGGIAPTEPKEDK